MIGMQDDAVTTKLTMIQKNEFAESDTTDDEDAKKTAEDNVCTKRNSGKSSVKISIALIKIFLTSTTCKGHSAIVRSRSGDDVLDLLIIFYMEVPNEKYIPNIFQTFFHFSFLRYFFTKKNHHSKISKNSHKSYKIYKNF